MSAWRQESELTHGKIRFAKNAKDKWCRMLNVQSQFRKKNSGTTMVEITQNKDFLKIQFEYFLSFLTHPVVLVVEVVSSGSVIVSDSTATLKLQIILLNFA